MKKRKRVSESTQSKKIEFRPSISSMKRLEMASDRNHISKDDKPFKKRFGW